MADYQIFTDATADIADCEAVKDGRVQVIPMDVQIGGDEYTYGPDGNLQVTEFYRFQRMGNFASTSRINPTVYLESFEPALRQGKDIIYLCFSSGMSGTVESAQLCMEELQEQYPQRKLICIDSLCASVGEGFLVLEAERHQREGMALEELNRWILENRMRVCHWFTVDTFEHLQHGGRVNTASAIVGTALKIKPMLHLNPQGKLQVQEKPRGRKRAIEAQISRMEQGWQPQMGKRVIIGHGDDREAAEELEEAVRAHFPEAEIETEEIGPIIGSHTGPGMLALIYWGNNR